MEINRIHCGIETNDYNFFNKDTILINRIHCGIETKETQNQKDQTHFN